MYVKLISIIRNDFVFFLYKNFVKFNSNFLPLVLQLKYFLYNLFSFNDWERAEGENDIYFLVITAFIFSTKVRNL